ncbi:M1 family metallopeptidase [Salisaeta longa]|uniref:M1 family metallopeptidase n=1 Tax=Salisaeta longa TaxID=503170 RepID=UPI0003B4257D|nr:M1 family metallopeptidase [Salisaeta longa]
MRRFLWSFPLVFVLLVGCRSMPQAAQQTQIPTPPAAASAVEVSPDTGAAPAVRPPVPAPGFREAVAAGTRTTTGRPGPNYWQQRAAYDLTARLYPSEHRLDGTARITYTNNAPDTLNTLLLELTLNHHKAGVVRNEPAARTGGVQLHSVAVNGQRLSADSVEGPRYRVQNTNLIVVPPSPVLPGATTELTVRWTLPIPQQGAGGRMGYSRDNLFFLAYWYPIMAVYDDVTGWMTDPFRGTAEFYSDFASYDITVHAPEGWVVQSTGTLQNPAAVFPPSVRARRQQAYASDMPVRILTPDQQATVDAPSDTLRWQFAAQNVRDVAFSLTRDAFWDAARTPVGDRDGDGLVDSTRINTFYRETAPKWTEVTRYQQHSITQHSAYTGIPYPWPHMTAVEGAGIIGGGMEFPMMTLMGDYNERSARDLYAVTAHELAHMWVPMMVSTNERRYSWIDEGTTSFSENVARKDFYAQSDAYAADRADYVAWATNGHEGPLMRWSDYHYSGSAFVIASYRKPATLYVALRALLGTETFNAAFQAFHRTWAYKHPYPSDFFHTFERVAGRALDWFWRSWYYETWTLDHAIAGVERSGGQVRVQLEDRGQAFMPTRVTLTLRDGTTLQRTLPVRVWLSGRDAAALVVQDVDASAVTRVEIDAAHVFPDVDRSNNVWTAANE